MKIDSLLSELGAHAGLPEVKMDAQGACRLVFDDEVALDLEIHPDNPDTLLLQTVVSTVPPEGRQQFYLQLLAANHRAMGSGVLSVIPDTREVVLWKSVGVQAMGVERLASTLSDTVRHARNAASWLSAHPEDPSAMTTPPDPMAMIRV